MAGGAVPAAVSDYTATLPGHGRPLPGSVRAFFEPRFGVDLRTVRVHADGPAAAAAHQVGARAYTVGEHIVFGAGQYAPETGEGRALLAHELAHTLQPAAGPRLARACEDDLKAMPIPTGDSTLKATVFANLSTVAITPDIVVSPLAGEFHVLMHLPRELQQLIVPSLLRKSTISLDVSGNLGGKEGAASAAEFAGNELCVFITFRRQPGAAGAPDEWYADVTLLPGSGFLAPILIGGGTPALAASGGPMGTSIARIQVQFKDPLTTTAGPVRLKSLDDLSTTWSQILEQLSDAFSVQLQNVEIPFDLRTRAALSVPVPLTSGGGSVLPVGVLGDMLLQTKVSSTDKGFSLKLSGSAGGTAAANFVSLELTGQGHLTGPFPEHLKLGDLTQDFLDDLVERSEGGGEITGRLRAFGFPGYVAADFELHGRRLVGDASFISPLALAGGSFSYHLDTGLTANLGMLGLTQLTVGPADDVLAARYRDLGPGARPGPAAFEFPSSATGLGLTGIRVTPRFTHELSIGVGAESLTTPTGESEVHTYGGIQYRLTFPWF